MESSDDIGGARAAVTRFYDALEALISGRGIAPMKEAWHHTEDASASHPMGDWSHGWAEVLATWEIVANVGVPENAGSTIRQLRVHVKGDMAYSTCVFVAGVRFGHATVNCTNVATRVDGTWRIVHHHADKSTSIERGLEEAAEGSS
jgi:ketosteroid isomerase-like protein